jgi:hypothetical protein
VRGNREFIAQALANILDNAIKYTPEGGAVMLRARRTSSGELEFSVTDTGPGVPEADRARVVQRFVRLENSRSEPGAGLGLSLVQAVAASHGGRLELAEGPGEYDGFGPGPAGGAGAAAGGVGGELLDPALLREISTYAHGKGIRLHLDGARLLLAPPGYDVAGTAALFDTVYVSLYKYLDAPFGAVLAGSKADIAKARALRHQFGGTIYQGWESAVLALAALDDFDARHKAAFATANQVFAALEKAGAAKLKPAPNASNIRQLVLKPKLAEDVFDRMRVAGVRLPKPGPDGTVDFWINDTINRRPAEDYVKLFLG